MVTEWSEWRPFPDPRKKGILIAPFGAGCYELRHRSNKSLILFGTSKNVAHRMSSLLPKPHGAGNRDNSDKRAYVLKHLDDIEYRTIAHLTPQEAELCEKELKGPKGSKGYIFNT
jgi:hypothetical protein